MNGYSNIPVPQIGVQQNHILFKSSLKYFLSKSVEILIKVLRLWKMRLANFLSEYIQNRNTK